MGYRIAALESDAADWTFALRLDELWSGEMVALRLHGSEVLLVKLGDDEVHAFDNRCPHAGAPLSEGRLRAATLRCAAHLWEFDIRSGAGINPRSCKLQRYPVRIVDGCVWLSLPRAAVATST